MEVVPTMETDGQLVARMARGDHAAVGELYERHAAYLMAIALRFVGRGEAEDLLHDVFLEAWRAAAAFDPARGRVRTWLIIRMRSRALDVVGSPRLARNAGDDHAYDGISEPPSLDHSRIRSALADLAVDQRRVVELAYFDGLTCREVARRIGIPVGTVKSRIAAAIAVLRARLVVPVAA